MKHLSLWIFHGTIVFFSNPHALNQEIDGRYLISEAGKAQKCNPYCLAETAKGHLHSSLHGKHGEHPNSNHNPYTDENLKTSEHPPTTYKP